METILKQIKIGRNKGNARIWIENGTLAKYGFDRYTPLFVAFANTDTITIHTTIAANTNGFTVAGRERNGKKISIIDINSAKLTAFVNGATTATVSYSDGILVITIGATL